MKLIIDYFKFLISTEGILFFIAGCLMCFGFGYKIGLGIAGIIVHSAVVIRYLIDYYQIDNNLNQSGFLSGFWKEAFHEGYEIGKKVYEKNN